MARRAEQFVRAKKVHDLPSTRIFRRQNGRNFVGEQCDEQKYIYKKNDGSRRRILIIRV